MRNPAAVAVATGSALAVGLVGAAPAVATAPPEIVVDEVVIEQVNPCTGDEHTLFIVVTDRVHAFDNEAGNRHHANLQGSFQVTTSDGFSGTVVGPAVNNGTGPFGAEEATGGSMFAELFNGVLSNPETGERFRFHQSFHVTEQNGVLIVESFTEVLQCLGRESS